MPLPFAALLLEPAPQVRRVFASSAVVGRFTETVIAFAALYGVVDRRSSPIDPALRSLVTVRVSQINNCAFCVDLNASTLLQRGVSIEKMNTLGDWRQSNLFDTRDNGSRLCRSCDQAGSAVEDGMIEGLTSHFSDDGIVESTALIAFQNMSSKFDSALGVDVPGFQRANLEAHSRSEMSLP